MASKKEFMFPRPMMLYCTGYDTSSVISGKVAVGNAADADATLLVRLSWRGD